MITKLLTILTSLAVGGAALFGLTSRAIAQDGLLQSSAPPSAVTTQIAPAPGEGGRFDRWSFRGDQRLHRALVLATLKVTGLRPEVLRAALEDDKSLSEIAASAGKSEAAVLAFYDDAMAWLFRRAVEDGKISEAVAQSRVIWFQQVARQVIDQPGLRPPYPALHELHRILLFTAVKVGDLDREQLRDGLTACKTLDQILQENDHSGQEAVKEAMSRINGWLKQLVKEDKMTLAQSQEWSESIAAALSRMITIPGLHLAGGKCAP
jgi:hypothetical protein